MSDDEPLPSRRRKGRRSRRQIEDDDDDEGKEEEQQESESKQTHSGSEVEPGSPQKSRRGRRSRRRQIEDDDDDDDADDDGKETTGDKKKNRERNSSRKREIEDDSDEDAGNDGRNMGWGSTSRTPSKGKRDRKSDKHKTAANWDDEAEGNDAIMVIPTLSSEDEEDVKGPDKDAVAQAPQASTLLPRSHELDEEIKSILPTATASGIDLSILTSCLVPQNLILEEDEKWAFDDLLQEVAIELQEEAEEKNNLTQPGEIGAEGDPDDF